MGGSDRPRSRGGSPDKVLLAEAMRTLEACADMLIAASTPSTSLEEALRLRRVIRVQLGIARRLIFAVRPRGGNMAVQAPAAGAADSAPAARQRALNYVQEGLSNGSEQQ